MSYMNEQWLQYLIANCSSLLDNENNGMFKKYRLATSTPG